MNHICLVSICAIAASIIMIPAASASLIASCPLAPGGSCVPPDDAGDTPGSLLAAVIDPFSFTTISGVTQGAIKSEVFREAGGTLDFYYIIFNAPASATSVMGEMDLNFSGWAVSVAFRSDGSNVPGFVDGNIPPSLANRDASGSNVGFTFGGVPPNERSRVVVVSTNAFSYAPGSMMVDGSGPLSTFQPAVPEPGSFVLLSRRLVAAALARKRCSRNRDTVKVPLCCSAEKCVNVP